MADSNITKKALALSLKQLMQQLPFEKISVGNICEACGMNRKSFYYHFKDKYDLVEWIFYTEFIVALSRADTDDKWDFLSSICAYFYSERSFYIKAMEIKGQNSFRQYFREYFSNAVGPFLKTAADGIFKQGEAAEFLTTFFCDALLVSIFRWLTDKEKMPPEEYVKNIKDMSEHLRIFIGKIPDIHPND